MRSAKVCFIAALVVFMYGVAAGVGYGEEGMGGTSDTQSTAAPAVEATQPATSAPAATDTMQPAASTQAVTPVPETTTPAAASVPAAAVVPSTSTASDTSVPAAATDASVTPAPTAEQPVAVPAMTPAVEEKKEEVKPVEKPKKKVAKLPDLEIVKVVTKTAGETDVELIVFVKNKGSKSAKAKDGSAISLAFRPEGDTATRVVKIGDEVKAGKKIEYSLGTYPKDKIEGKNIFVMVTFDGKEANKQNNVWNKPAKACKK